MKILVACEESQRVTEQFRLKGHEAYSCDVIAPSGGHPEWHIQADVLPLLNGDCTFTTNDEIEHKIDGQWDMIIAFPPCTHLTSTGARFFEAKRKSGVQAEAIEFFGKIKNANCEKIVIENPKGIINGTYITTHFPELCEQYGFPYPPTQIIQPWMFGDEAQKTTCLWIKGLRPLVPEITEAPEINNFVWIDKKTGKQKAMNRWYYETSCLPHKDRAKARSKTFPGIARAMGEQWG